MFIHCICKNWQKRLISKQSNSFGLGQGLTYRGRGQAMNNLGWNRVLFLGFCK